MSDRIQKLIEAGEAMRQFDIELGAKQERERIIALLEAKRDEYNEANLWADSDGISNALELIKGENE